MARAWLGRLVSDPRDREARQHVSHFVGHDIPRRNRPRTLYGVCGIAPRTVYRLYVAGTLLGAPLIDVRRIGLMPCPSRSEYCADCLDHPQLRNRHMPS